MSFYEGIVNLQPGLTVIVGPNGSGKSAIFHAIKFGLGSNQREDRYGKWSDFIRWGARSAEIEIVVKIGKNRRTFKRRIDSDGVPRAYIDGKRVRAAEYRRSVEELGFDVDNPLVFMPQERVTALKDASPMEVRRLVEEGTGLDTIRDRIFVQETELSSDRQRLEQAIAETRAVENELYLLSGDLKRLEKKREYLRQQQVLDREYRWARLLDLEARIEMTKKQIDSQQEGVTDLLEEKTRLMQEIEELDVRAAHLDNEHKQLERNLGKVEAEIKSEKNRLEIIKKGSSETLDEIRRVEDVIERDKKRLTRLSDDIKRAMVKCEHGSAKRKQLEQELLTISEEIKVFDEQLLKFEKWYKEIRLAKEKISEIEGWIKNFGVQYRAFQTKRQYLEAELEKIDDRWGSSWSILESTSMDELKRELKHLDARLGTLTEEKVAEKSRRSELQKELNELDLKLSEVSGRIPHGVQDLKSALEEHGLTTVIGPVSELLHGQDELAFAIEAVLSNDFMFAFLTTDYADFQIAQKLRDNLEAPSPIILIDTSHDPDGLSDLPQNAKVLGWLWNLVDLDGSYLQMIRCAFGDYVVTTDVRTAAHLSKSGVNAVTIKGHVYEKKQFALVGHPRIKVPRILSTAPILRHRKDTERELKRVVRRIEDIDVEIKTVSEERGRILSLISQMGTWETTWQRRGEILKELPEVQDKLAEISRKLEQLESERDVAQQALNELIKKQPVEREKIVAEKQAVEIRYRKIDSALADVCADIKIAEQAMKNLRAQLDEVRENIEIMEGRREELVASIDQSEDELVEVHERINDLERDKKELEQQEKILAKTIDDLRQEQRRLTKQLAEIDMQLRTSTREVNKLRVTLNNLELRMQDALLRVEGIERPERIRNHETVHVELVRISDILSEYDDVNDSIEIKSRQLNDRLRELAERVTDLRKELNEAETTIAAIKKQYFEEMTETLRHLEVRINDVLRQTGFKGEVRLDLDNNVETGGIHFQTRIKGGEFKSIKVGSGGERTILIIALIVALHKFNPAPIYALDEVDIFLDSKNTEAIGRLFKSASLDSQLVVFTPGKSTHLLKHADRILGVVTPEGNHPTVLIESPRFRDGYETVAN